MDYLSINKTELRIFAEETQLICSFDYNQKDIDIIKTFPNRKYDANKKVWILLNNKTYNNMINLKLSEIYTHVSTKTIGTIRSPLDDLDV